MRLLARFRIIALAAVPGAALAAAPAPGVCGVSLGAPLSKARSAFDLHRAGAVTYAIASNLSRAIRWEGVVRPGRECAEVRAAPAAEPSVVVSTTATKPQTVVALSHRTPSADCIAAEGDVSNKLGPPASSSDEVVEWHPSAHHIVILTRHRGEDCWLSHVARSAAHR